MHMRFIAWLFLLLIAGFSCRSAKMEDDSPARSWAIRFADAVMARHDSLVKYNSDALKWQYDVALLAMAIDRAGGRESSYAQYMKDYMDCFVMEEGTVKKYRQADYNLDHINPAKNLLTLYKRTGNAKYLAALPQFIEQLEKQPRTPSGGFWHKMIYPNQMWLDGVYMSSPFMAQYAVEFGELRWLDTVLFQVKLIYSKTLDPQTGLLYHAWDESRMMPWANPETGCSPNFWGRAMGWYMMALVDVLGFFPENHAGRTDLLEILNKVSAALLKVRDNETGLWYQVLDRGGDEGNYIEASCSGMFVYAFAKAANNSWLPESYLEVAEKSFEAMLKHFVITGEDGMPTLTQVCGAAGLGGNPYRDGTYEYYINEKKADNDPKGVGPFILAAIELKK